MSGYRLRPDLTARVLHGRPLRGFVTERMGSLYAPAVVHLVHRLPRAAAGKPDRNALRANLVRLRVGTRLAGGGR
ncbi:hypothetical protein ACFWBF_08850 [Streptomyces sp. NPDC060028]|uniref:hypothetical protein n=1 Tax=Streptomyces sp. NPDC060028 TaxID=3347041 RepID=UPI0036A54BEE